MVKVIIITIVLVAIALAAISIKILLKKNGRFSGTCSSRSAVVQEEGSGCSICGAKPEEKCKKS